jgi:hypothetical protein
LPQDIRLLGLWINEEEKLDITYKRAGELFIKEVALK